MELTERERLALKELVEAARRQRPQHPSQRVLHGLERRVRRLALLHRQRHAQRHGHVLAADDVELGRDRAARVEPGAANRLVERVDARVRIGRNGRRAVTVYRHAAGTPRVDRVVAGHRGFVIEAAAGFRFDRPVFVGDVIDVKLTLIAPNDLHYVVIEDPIPAGTDAVNPNLNTSQQTGTQPELNLADPLSQGWGWWYFSSIAKCSGSSHLFVPGLQKFKRWKQSSFCVDKSYDVKHSGRFRQSRTRFSTWMGPGKCLQGFDYA